MTPERTPERRVEAQPGWEPDWEPSGAVTDAGTDAGIGEEEYDPLGDGGDGEAAEQPVADTADAADTADVADAASGEGSAEAEQLFGRRSLYEELGLSLDLYDAERGDEPSIAGLLERHANGRDYAGPYGGGYEPEPIDAADPSISPLPEGTVGTDTRTYSFGDRPEGTSGDVAQHGGATPAPPPPVSYGTAPRVASHRHRPTSDNLTAERVLRQRRTPPTKGWRRAVLGATGGTVNLGPSAKELRERELEERCRVPIHGCHKLAVISLKGGVGKTTTVAALGSMFATLRGDRVIAVDANPDRGTLGEKIVGEVTTTVRDFVGRSPRLQRYADVREFTAQAPSRLEVLSSESDPLASMAFSEQDYRVVSDVLERFYSLILTDCGTGLLHSAMVGVLAMADQIIVVSSASLDGARSASATLDWLDAHGYEALANDSVTVISSVRPRAEAVDLDEIEDHFAARSRAVARIPYDPHLSAGGRIELDQLKPSTYEAYLHLAAEVAEGFERTGS